jgi:predicted amidophosphoribosyltransferase
MVKALKEQSFNGYFEIIAGTTRRRFDRENASEFLPVIHRRLARAILQRTEGPLSMVPIPNSPVTFVDHPDFRTKKLAEGIARYGGGRLSCVPYLVFSEPQPSSHSGGGSREPLHLESVYRLVGQPTGTIVLIDDVLTTGAHLIGAYWKLADTGCDVALASTWGRTTAQQLNPVWEDREELLDLGRQAPEFEDFDFDLP